MDFTVILKYPSFMSDGDDDEYFIDRTKASSAQEAVDAVRENVARDDDSDEDDEPDYLTNPNNFAVVAVFEGRCTALWAE